MLRGCSGLRALTTLGLGARDVAGAAINTFHGKQAEFAWAVLGRRTIRTRDDVHMYEGTAMTQDDVSDRTWENTGDLLDASTSRASLRRSERRSRAIEQEIAEDPTAFRMLTGDRPTGCLHVGHYFGSLVNRLRLQDAGVETLIVIADYQVITDRDGTGPIRDYVYSLVTDYLAIGIDPSKTTIFTHSSVPALNQLMLPFLSLVSDSELYRNPTVKAEREATGNRPMSGLLLTYPVHQAADILFCKANLVPVGKDQLPHLEQARVIARRFDERYGRCDPTRPVFPEPEALLSSGSLILGLDGTKMSKSRNNAIELGMTEDETAKLIKRAITDPERHITYEPERRPEVANLLRMIALCTGRSPEEVAEEIGVGGAGALKNMLSDALNETLAPIRARRAELARDIDYLAQVLKEGGHRANELAESTLCEVRSAMNMRYV